MVITDICYINSFDRNKMTLHLTLLTKSATVTQHRAHLFIDFFSPRGGCYNITV